MGKAFDQAGLGDQKIVELALQLDRVTSFDVPEKRDYTFNERATLYLYTVPAR